MKNRKKKKYYHFSKKLKVLDEKVGDFEDNAIPKVTLHENCDDEVFDLDMCCTDYGDAISQRH